MQIQTDLCAIEADVRRRARSVPFGNSRFQNLYFVAGVQDGPARQARAVLLRLFELLAAVRKAGYDRRRSEVEMRRLQARAADPAVDPFDRETALIDLDERLAGEADADKLTADAETEIRDLYAVLCAHPAYSREEFEALEGRHYLSSLGRQVDGTVGAVEALLAVQRRDVLGVAPLEVLPSAAGARLADGREEGACTP